MGCWNATCNVSRLPIFAGDDIVVIPLVATMGVMATSACYATSNFAPFVFPIIGKYDDYGGIEDAVITPENDLLIRSYEFYKSNGDGTEPYKVEIGDDMEKFISEELCHEAYYIKTTNFRNYPDGFALVSVFFVHKGLYDILISEMGSRTPYGQSECYRDLLKKKFEHEVSLCREKDRLIDDVQEENRIVEEWKYDEFGVLSALAGSVFCRGEMMTPCREHWKLLAEEFVNSPNEGIIDMAVDKALFIHALSALRMGFHCDSGTGSQSSETHIHYVLAKFVIEHIRDRAKKEQEYSTEVIPEDGTEEMLFFY